MTLFPATVELNTGTWTDISDDLRHEDGVSITRGRSAEGSQADPSKCELALDNRDGKYAPRNPEGPHFGLIGRNTPIRVKQGSADGYLLQQSSTAYAWSDVGWSLTGDMDVRIDVEPDDWSRRQELADLNGTVGATDRVAWLFRKDPDGTLRFSWSPDGNFASVITAASTVPVSLTGRKTLRVTLDVNNGAAGNDVRFYTGDSISGPWTQLGATVTNAGTTSTYLALQPQLRIGQTEFVATPEEEGLIGKVYRFRIYAGLAENTLRADPNFTTQEPGSGSFVDAAAIPNTWELFEGSVVQPSIRFSGEIPDWPQEWDKSGSEAKATLEASGVSRRLGQGKDVLESATRRGIGRLEARPVAYWPCEDESGATVVASAIPSAPPMTVVSGEMFEPAAYEGIAGSKPILLLGNAAIRGPVPPYPFSLDTTIRFVGSFPAAGETDGSILLNAVGIGSVKHWRIIYRTGGDLQLIAVDGDDVEVENATLDCNLNGKDFRCSLELRQLTGPDDVDWTLNVHLVDDGTIGTGSSFSGTVSRITHITLNSDLTLETVAVGHVTLQTGQSGVGFVSEIADQLTGFNGETAGRRIARLCGEENVAFRWVGDPDATVVMGPQKPQAFLDLLREAEETDGGILFEPRDLLGLAYRSRASMYSQDAVLTLDYPSEQVSFIKPADDDQRTLNDATVARIDGSSARYEETAGPLSVSPPPDGVGRYDKPFSLSLLNDDDLLDHAAWRVHLGTVDEPRFPQIGANAASAGLLQDSVTVDALKRLDVGDRLVITHPPIWTPPDSISQLAIGFNETIQPFEYTVIANCQPESPWRIGVLEDDALGRLDTDGSTLAASVTSTATALSVATTDAGSPLWTVDGAEFPFDVMVGGELMTVTAISGGSSPQAFTVVRSVNDVVKAHSSGSDVRLAQPIILGL